MSGTGLQASGPSPHHPADQADSARDEVAAAGASSLPPGAEPAEAAASWLYQDVLVLHF